MKILQVNKGKVHKSEVMGITRDSLCGKVRYASTHYERIGIHQEITCKLCAKLLGIDMEEKMPKKNNGFVLVSLDEDLPTLIHDGYELIIFESEEEFLKKINEYSDVEHFKEDYDIEVANIGLAPIGQTRALKTETKFTLE